MSDLQPFYLAGGQGPPAPHPRLQTPHQVNPGPPQAGGRPHVPARPHHRPEPLHRPEGEYQAIFLKI